MSEPTTQKGKAGPSHRLLKSSVIKDTMHFTTPAAETGGKYTEVTCTLGPGSGNPLHYHTRFVEVFRGSSDATPLGVVLDGKDVVLKEGEEASVLLGHAHRLFNPSPTEVAEFTCRLEPGDEGFEKGFTIVYGLSADGLTDGEGIPKNPVHIAILTEMMDTWLVGWGFWLATPLLAGLRWYGKWSGEEERLLKKYWHAP